MVLLNNLENDVSRMWQKCKKYKEAKKFLNRITKDWGDWYLVKVDSDYKAVLSDCDKDEELLGFYASSKKKATKKLAKELLKTISYSLQVEYK